MNDLFNYLQILTPILLEGLKLTIFISVISFISAIILGTILAVIQHLKIKGLTLLVKIYTSFFRSTPLLVQIFIFYFGLPIVLSPLRALPALWAIIICLSLNSSSYIAETIRGSIEGVETGQYEACEAFGMSKAQTMVRVILPQAAVSAIPPISNSAIDIVKGSSLGLTIGIADMMGLAQITASAKFKFLETYVYVAIIYWILGIVLGKIQNLIEIKFSKAYLR